MSESEMCTDAVDESVLTALCWSDTPDSFLLSLAPPPPPTLLNAAVNV